MLGRRLYYSVKPYLPWSWRVAARRVRARRKRTESHGHWPIHPDSARPPEGWPGWPEGKKFAFVLTHDVEGPEGLARCRRLAELEAGLGFRSSFNLIPEGTYRVQPELCEWLAGQGFEVGIHDLHHDGRLFASGSAFQTSALWINRHLKEWGAVGFRSGFMLHDLDWIHDLDIEYDASTFDTDPFEPQPDGTATIFPFWVPPPADKPGRRGYLELPYTLAQDSTLFLILRERSPAIWLDKLDWVARHGGMALVNVHPDYVRFPGERADPKTYPVDHYVKLLEHVRSAHAGDYWQPLPRALSRQVAPHRPRHYTRRRRACLVTYSFYESDSRVSRYGETLAENGDEVDVLALRRGPGLAREETIGGCRVVRLQDRHVNEKSPASFLWRLVRFLLRAARWIGREHRRRPYDILHFHNVPDFLVFAGWRPKAAGAKLILDIHDIVPELFQSKFGASPRSLTVRLLKGIERASAAFADHVILANHLWLDLYAGRSAPREKVSVLVNYVDARIFAARRRRPRQDGRKIVIFPGSLQTHQGLDVAIRSFPKVVAAVPEAELHIYGEGPAKTALAGLAVALGLNGHVKFFGLLPTREIAGIMAEADLGVVPKRADSFGNEAYSTKILEFMSLGVPVVASSTKIDRFYFNDSVLRFFESGNSEALAGHLIDVLKDPQGSREMAERARAHAAQNSWESHKGEYLALVDRLCPVK